MTAPTTDRDPALKPPPAVDALIGVAAARFGDLGYLAPDGLLDLPLDATGVQAIRLELPAGQSLRLQSMQIDAEGVADIADMARVQASGRRSGDGRPLDAAALFDFERPTGTVIETGAEGPAWAEVTFARPLTVTRLGLRNVADETARLGTGPAHLGQGSLAESHRL